MKQFRELFDNLDGKTTLQAQRQVETLIGESVLITGYISDVSAHGISLSASESMETSLASVYCDSEVFRTQAERYSLGDEARITARIVRAYASAGWASYDFHLIAIDILSTASERHRVRAEAQKIQAELDKARLEAQRVAAAHAQQIEIANERKKRLVQNTLNGGFGGAMLGGVTGCYSCVVNAPKLDTLLTPFNAVNGLLYGTAVGLVAGFIFGIMVNEVAE